MIFNLGKGGGAGGGIRYDATTDMIQIQDELGNWVNWKSGGQIEWNLSTETMPSDWLEDKVTITSTNCNPLNLTTQNSSGCKLRLGFSRNISGYNRFSVKGWYQKRYSSGCYCTIRLIGKNTGTTYYTYEAVKASDTSTGTKNFEKTQEINILEDCYVEFEFSTTTGAANASIENIYFYKA